MAFLVRFILSKGIFLTFAFYFNISMYSVLNKLSEYSYFYISKKKKKKKNLLQTLFLPVFKYVESLQCVLKNKAQLEIKKLFFMSDEFISRKQFFKISDMGYDI